MSYFVSEERARVAVEALAALSGQIRAYCRSYPGRLDGLKGKSRRRALARFLENGGTLADMLDRLIASAREIEALGILNFEQLEADAADARTHLAAIRALEMSWN